MQQKLHQARQNKKEVIKTKQTNQRIRMKAVTLGLLIYGAFVGVQKRIEYMTVSQGYKTGVFLSK